MRQSACERLDDVGQQRATSPRTYISSPAQPNSLQDPHSSVRCGCILMVNFAYLRRCGLCTLSEDPSYDEREINNFGRMRGYLVENGKMTRNRSIGNRSNKRLVVTKAPQEYVLSHAVEYDGAPKKVVPRDNWERANVRYGLSPRKFIFSNQSGMTVYMVVTARPVEETSAAIEKLATVIDASTTGASSDSMADLLRFRASARAQKMFVTKGTQQEIVVEESYAYISVLSRDRLNNWVEHVRNNYVDVGYTKAYQFLPADVVGGKTLDKAGESAYGVLL